MKPLNYVAILLATLVCLPSVGLSQDNVVILGFEQLKGAKLGYGVDIMAQKKKKRCLKSSKKGNEPLYGFATAAFQDTLKVESKLNSRRYLAWTSPQK